ncbi:hypothetical protein Tco_0700807 [Tanacetum coccineum]
MGALEDPPFVASLLDIGGCLEEVDCFLCPVLAPGFVPWKTFISVCEEVLGALKTTGFPALQIAMGCEGRSFSMVALQCPVIDTEDLIGVYYNVTISIPILHSLHH